MYEFLLQLHSVFRWLVIILLLICLINAGISWAKKSDFKNIDFILNRYLLMIVHIQLLVGIILYFVSPNVKVAMGNIKLSMATSYLRYWLVEHPSAMLIAIVLITMGYVRAKKQNSAVSKNRNLSIFYLIAAIIIIGTLPWPFRDVIGRPWI